ncbi:FkbM family methyltransferase [Confluentibacter sediminis]|uniref:FkbM family methyltransferase n=1 Tax=Confluentibacter sediminis TaxID=2219045 RepID=UPI000DAB9278|nr:FkbM family methyltransferase [Confluentibacter sediminis]
MQKDKIKRDIFDLFNKVFGHSFTRKGHHLYKSIFDTDSRFEKELISKTLMYLNSGATVLDIGANIGRWAISISKKTGPQGTIHAFEPNKETFDFLTNRTKSFKNVIAHNVALSSGEREEVEFLIQKGISCPPNAAIAETASQIRNKEDFTIIKVKSKSIDGFLEANNIKTLDFIKIDVEGHELEVMRGFKKGLKRFKPILGIEILRDKWKNNNPSNSDVAQLILKEGYIMGQFNELTIFYEFDEAKFQQDFQNFIFIPKPNK